MYGEEKREKFEKALAQFVGPKSAIARRKARRNSRVSSGQEKFSPFSHNITQQQSARRI